MTLPPPVVAAIITAISAIIIAAITYALTKRREREAEWRQFKLSYYREYVNAMSGITGASITPEGRRRFASAANDLSLVAPPQILRAAYALIEESNSSARTPQGYEAALAALFRELRKDSHPSVPNDADLIFRLYAPPATESLRDAVANSTTTASVPERDREHA